MMARLNRQQRRDLARHAEAVDQALEGDRRFFSRHRHSTYRVRLLSAAEFAQLKILDGPLRLPLETPVPFAAVKQLAPGVRVRVFVFSTPAAIGEELTEEEACRVYEGYADRHPWVREREVKTLAALRNAAEQAGSEAPPSRHDSDGRAA